LELGAVVAARMGDGDLAEDRFLDPLDCLVAEDAGVHQFGAELQKSNGGGLRAQPNELERAMQLARAFGLIMIHHMFSGTGPPVHYCQPPPSDRNRATKSVDSCESACASAASAKASWRSASSTIWKPSRPAS